MLELESVACPAGCSGQEQRKNSMPRPSFPPGKSGNPKGRPRGAKDVVPKVRALVNAVLEGNEAAIQEAYRRAVLSPKTVLQCLELAAKLNREVDASALPLGLEADGPVKVILGWGDGD
jgi:Family of unknown function (DUF5681)